MLPRLHAEAQLAAIQVVSVPHMKQDAIDRLFARLQRLAGRERRRPLAEQLMSAMKVVQVPTKKVTDGG